MVNPVYSAAIAHQNPLDCPLGALALYVHWLYDMYDLLKVENIDFTVNSSWRSASFTHH